jgi:hypothetical protein
MARLIIQFLIGRHFSGSRAGSTGWFRIVTVAGRVANCKKIDDGVGIRVSSSKVGRIFVA